ncbi:MAG TPA: GDP-mannose 4,6-dehydratase [Capillimicrobium sp.]|nr:GDP-mannose 4,6-dehydratase [Capillimicrobium sp.]
MSAPRSVLVTGAYGMLGGWLTKALLDRGDRVTVLKRDDVPGSLLALEDVERRCSVVHGDLIDPGLIDRAIGEHEVDTVFHLAAQTIVGTASRSPLSTWESNVRGTYLLMEACRTQQVARVVVASSDKAYGAHERLPYTEDMALQPTFPYDVSKAATDLIARSYWHTYGVPVATTRFANLYGGGDRNRSRLVPEAIAAALAGRAPVIRSGGTPERDFLYVEDAAAAYLAIADALDETDPARTARGHAFNAGGDTPHSVLEVVELVCRLAGTDVEPDVRGTGTPDGEIDRQYVDSTKLRERTGWRPEVGLEEGLRRAIAWYRQHGS